MIARCDQLTDLDQPCIRRAGHNGAHLPTPTVQEVLAFEARPMTRAGKLALIEAELGISPVRYYQILNRAIDTVTALEVNPILVHRLLAKRDSNTRTNPTIRKPEQ